MAKNPDACIRNNFNRKIVSVLNNIEVHELRVNVIAKLKNIIDPELGVNIVDLGLIYQAYLKEDVFHLVYTVTTPGCPVRRYIERQIEAVLNSMDEIRKFNVELVLKPDWSVNMIKEGVEFFSVPPPVMTVEDIS